MARSGKRPNSNIAICGAGIAGPALALRLLRYGFQPTLIERAPRFRDGGYMIDIWGTGYDVIEAYGLAQAARTRGYLFDRLAMVDANGRETASFGGPVFRRVLADRFFSIPRGDLARTLHEAIGGRAETLYGTSIRALRETASGVEVELTTGETREFDLVIGADGLRSTVRDLAFGPASEVEVDLGYGAASFFADGYPHRDEGVYVSHGRPGRQISRYAMREGRTAFLLVFARDAGEGSVARDLAAQRALLRKTFGADGWETPEILARLDAADDLYFDSVSQIRMPRWSRGRVALIGDAAHSPSLLAGAGAALAMLGAYVLAGELDRADGDYRQASGACEDRLRPYMQRQQKAAVGFAGAFAPKTSLGLAVRDGVLRLMNLPPLGGLSTKLMLGESFPLPTYR
ncbi:MAG TPA: FAD-binding domain [Phenylobacterium sp.]|jgi:2-polyprenyl-6-methoxyphenol hydroxylase-like FAD-dependent oxidoreductase|nr:FAD-binding domain [Phenylobacterium sp.]